MIHHSYFLIVRGKWKFENGHFYHYEKTGNQKGTVRFMRWRKIL